MFTRDHNYRLRRPLKEKGLFEIDPKRFCSMILRADLYHALRAPRHPRSALVFSCSFFYHDRYRELSTRHFTVLFPRIDQARISKNAVSRLIISSFNTSSRLPHAPFGGGEGEGVRKTGARLISTMVGTRGGGNFRRAGLLAIGISSLANQVE